MHPSVNYFVALVVVFAVDSEDSFEKTMTDASDVDTPTIQACDRDSDSNDGCCEDAAVSDRVSRVTSQPGDAISDRAVTSSADILNIDDCMAVEHHTQVSVCCYTRVKAEVEDTRYSASSSENLITEALGYGTCCQGITQFYLPPMNGVNCACVCLRSHSWYWYFCCTL